MILGVPKEIKKDEFRVAMAPEAVRELASKGHQVLVEQGAGEGSGFPDTGYSQAGASVVNRAAVFNGADLIIKVKEPVKEEFGLFRQRQALFTFLHLAPNPELIGMLLEKNISALAYETLEAEGGLPLLAPMSEIAGRMAPLMGMFYMQRRYGGRGIFPPGVAGVKPAVCVIAGAGTAGTNAARVASELGMETLVLNKGMDRLRKLDEMFMGKVRTAAMTEGNLKGALRDADLAIFCVLVPGARTPVLVNRDLLRTMKKGAVVVDISIDQGGTLETSRPTTHEDPVYVAEGVVHYCVANMPGAYPRTSTIALSDTTLPYITMLADKGVEAAVVNSTPLRTALNIYRGRVVHPALAHSLGTAPASIDELMSAKPAS
ncbi:MAG: alanine dehydrogenase [Actinomycetota bacterium]|nr:alanine dehydrogenase [Actinomycetota bacterium]